MPIGPSRRPQEPLHIFGMALALALAAFTGGALGLVWHWIAAEDLPEDQVAAASELEEQAEEEEHIAVPAPSPSPTAPNPSPNAT